MRRNRLLTMLLCCSTALTLFGCRKKDHILDGPGMEYVPQWTSFTLSRCDSNAQHSFWFRVIDDGEQPLLTGTCRDEHGDLYENEEGIPLSVETLWQLRWLNLEKLEAPKAFPEDLEPVLDDRDIKLSLVLPNGDTVEKNASADLSMEIYQLLLPYFRTSK